MFVKEYVYDLNATRAYLEVYKNASHKVATNESSRLLKKKEVKDAIAKELNPIFDNLEVSKEKVLREYCTIAFSNPYDFITQDGEDIKLKNKDDIPEPIRNAVRKMKVKKSYSDDGDLEVTVEFELHDKLKALDQLSKYLKLTEQEEEKEETSFEINIGYDPKLLKGE